MQANSTQPVVPTASPRSPSALAFLLVLALPLAACKPEPTAPPPPVVPRPLLAGPPAPERAAARFQECRGKLEAAVTRGQVVNASVDNGRPVLWVGAGWKLADTAGKEVLARDTACFFLSGDESKTIKFSIYDNATDSEVAVWDSDHLVVP